MWPFRRKPKPVAPRRPPPESDTLQCLAYWERVERGSNWFLAVINKGRGQWIVELLDFHYTEESGRNKKRVHVSAGAPKKSSDARQIGAGSLEWERDLRVRSDQILHVEPVPDFDMFNYALYDHLIEHGLKVAEGIASHFKTKPQIDAGGGYTYRKSVGKKAIRSLRI